MTRSVEVISTVERRRRWTAGEKVAILDEAFRPGGSVAAAADRNEVSRALIYLWRKQVRAGEIPGVSVSAKAVARFAPVQVVEPPKGLPDTKPSSRRSAERRRSSMIEVALANGRVVKAEESVDPTLLARIVAALDDDARLQQDGGPP